MRSARTAAYYNDEDKQIKPFPAKWMSAAACGFKVGQKVVGLEESGSGHYVGEGNEQAFVDDYEKNARTAEFRPLAGVVGTIIKVRDGYGRFPPRNIAEDGEEDCWAGQHAAWVVVHWPGFVFGCSGHIDRRVPETARAYDVTLVGARFGLVKRQAA
jgi:hypothetical protein